MRQICKGYLVTCKVLVLGKNSLIALEGRRELRKENLDASLVGRAKTLAGFEDFLESDLRDERVKVSLFNGEGLHPLALSEVRAKVSTYLLVQSPGLQIGLGRGKCGSLTGVLAGEVLSNRSAFYSVDISVLL